MPMVKKKGILEEAKEKLEGKKTYIAATIIMLTALYQIAETGTVDLAVLKDLAIGFGFYGMRSAIFGFE